MATPNYSYEKRQRELAKKKKNEEKRLRKLNPRPEGAPADGEAASGEPGSEATGDTPPAEGQA